MDRRSLRIGGCAVAVLVLLSFAAPLAASSPTVRGSGPATGAPPLGETATAGPSGVAQPAATMALGFTGLDPTAVALNWTATTVFLPGSYTVEYSTNGSGGPWTTAAVVANSATSTVVSGLSPGGDYWWMVTVSGTLGGSESSNVLAVPQPSLAYLWNSAETSTSVTLNWTNNATYAGPIGFGSYALYEAQNGSLPIREATLTNVSQLSATVAGLTPGASYSFFLNTTDCDSACATASEYWTDSNSVTVGTVYALSVTITAGRSEVDTGVPDLFTCTPSGGESPFQFTWDFGNGTNVSGAGSVSHAFASAGAVDVSCSVTDHVANHASASVNVSVQPYPSVVASTNRTAADVGETVSYRCSAVGGTFPTELEWSFGDNVTYDGGNTTHVYGAAGTYAAVCSVVDGAGGSYAETIPLNVSRALGAVASVSSTAAAPATELTFTGTPENGSAPYSNLTWAFGDGTTGAGASATHAYGAAGNYTATFRVRDANGGVATATVRVAVTAVDVTVDAIPSSIGRGSAVTFSASATGGAGGPYNFTWQFGDGAVGYGATPTHTYSAGGTFTPTVTVRDRLGGNATVTLDTLTVTVPPAPGPWFTPFLVLLVAAVLGLLIAIVVLARRRRSEQASVPDALSRWVPPTGPQRSVGGSRVCASCGASNLSIRRTCSNCGAALPRTPPN